MRIALALFTLILVPGLPVGTVLLRRVRGGPGWLALAGTVGILWSLLTTLAATLVHLPLHGATVTTVSALPLVLMLFTAPRRITRECVEKLRAPPAEWMIALLTTALLAVPLVTVQRGLPTGDIQKSLYWAERILTEHRLPSYQEALRLNRDPADFATPGLHALTAGVIALSGDLYRGPAWFSLVSAVLLAGIAASFGKLLAPQSRLLPVLAFLLTASNARFLRYVAAPGYHYQNLLGELFLAASLFFLLQTVGGRGGFRYLLLSGVLVLTLPLVHQFTAFLALFLVPLVFLLIVSAYRAEVGTLLAQTPRPRRRAMLLVFLGLTAALMAGLSRFGAQKLTHLFATSPHLALYVVPLADLPSFLGEAFTLLGLAGILVASVGVVRRNIDWRWILVLAWAALITALSQGPRWRIDIPSARSLFYAVMPTALLASLAITQSAERVRTLWPRAAHALLPILLALTIAATAGFAMNTSLQGIDHSLQANATLTPDTLALLDFLKQHPPACPPHKQSEPTPDETRAGGAPLRIRMSESVGDPAGVDRRSGHGAPPEVGRTEEVVAASEPRWGERAAAPRLTGTLGSDCPDAILIDDWNRRRSTWTILSPYRMLTRVGADIAVIARERTQSKQRDLQYLTLMDFEKVYALGNSPVITPLLSKYGIAYVVGANGLSEDMFAHNPALEPVYRNAEVTVFKVRTGVRARSGPGAPLDNQDADQAFLLDPLTLANDIGDAEDVFAHLPVSVLAPQISPPITVGAQTVRDVESPMSSIGLNVGTYVPGAWTIAPDRTIDLPVELRLTALGNGTRGRVARGTTVLASFTLPDDGRSHEIRARIPSGQLLVDEQGLAFVSLRLDNGPLRLDAVAARPIP